MVGLFLVSGSASMVTGLVLMFSLLSPAAAAPLVTGSVGVGLTFFLTAIIVTPLLPAAAVLEVPFRTLATCRNKRHSTSCQLDDYMLDEGCRVRISLFYLRTGVRPTATSEDAAADEGAPKPMVVTG